MSTTSLEVVNRMSTQANNLFQAAMKLAQDMGHHVVDPSHVIVAAMASQHEGTYRYTTASYPLMHPVHKSQSGAYEDDTSQGLGLDYHEALNSVADMFPVPAKDLVVQHFTGAMRRMLELAQQFAEQEYEQKRREGNDPYGQVTISVFNLAWAAVESGSVPVDRLIPDKERAKHAFFRLNGDSGVRS